MISITPILIMLPVALLAATAVLLAVSSPTLARKKGQLTYSCNCYCEYKDSEDHWVFGNEINFNSTNQCKVFGLKSWNCYDKDGHEHSGRMTLCTTTSEQVIGGAPRSGAVADPGAPISQPDEAIGGYALPRN